MSKCPECNTKLRKFSGGLICQKNHKFSAGSNVYNDIQNETKIKSDYGNINTSLCPICQTKWILMCKCINSEMRCDKNHIWTSKYYQGDKRYLCVDLPDNNQHVFNFS